MISSKSWSRVMELYYTCTIIRHVFSIHKPLPGPHPPFPSVPLSPFSFRFFITPLTLLFIPNVICTSVPRNIDFRFKNHFSHNICVAHLMHSTRQNCSFHSHTFLLCLLILQGEWRKVKLRTWKHFKLQTFPLHTKIWPSLWSCTATLLRRWIYYPPYRIVNL